MNGQRSLYINIEADQWGRLIVRDMYYVCRRCHIPGGGSICMSKEHLCPFINLRRVWDLTIGRFNLQDTWKNACGNVSRAWMRFRESNLETIAVFLRNGAGISTSRIFVLSSCCLMLRGGRPHIKNFWNDTHKKRQLGPPCAHWCSFLYISSLQKYNKAIKSQMRGNTSHQRDGDTRRK